MSAKPATISKNKYNAKVYDSVRLVVKKGEKDKIRGHAEQNGESLNGFINRAIKETIQRDNEMGETKCLSYADFTI